MSLCIPLIISQTLAGGFLLPDDNDTYRKCERCLPVGLLFPTSKRHGILGTIQMARLEKYKRSVPNRPTFGSSGKI
jgi:hypothetical protein